MVTIITSILGAFFAAKRSHFAILIIILALVSRRASNKELLKALAMLSVPDQKAQPRRAARTKKVSTHEDLKAQNSKSRNRK